MQNKNIIVIGEHKKALQAMLDYDFIIGKEKPSILGVVSGNGKKETYAWGSNHIVLPVYESVQACSRVEIPWGAVIMVSSRNVLQVVQECITEGIKHIFILAENVRERDARVMRALAKKYNVLIIGPASVGVLYAGELKLSHAGGIIDNVIREKLFVQGTVGIVSKSGGMLNELMSIVTSSGLFVHTAIAIGGDRFPVTRLAEAVEILLQEEKITTILVLGEIGGTQENELALLLQQKQPSKKIIVHILGVGAKHFDTTIQFGHAGAMAEHDEEKAEYKITALRKAGALVVEQAKDIRKALKEIANKESLKHTTAMSTPKRDIPKDFDDALKDGDIRYTPHIVSNVSHTYTYAKEHSLGQVVFKLWFNIDVNEKQAEYIELILRLLADHGAAVSGAHNTIVASRAGKDLVSSLTSGLLTIGPRFGGAINACASHVLQAVSQELSPEGFVQSMKESNIPIPGIGHKIYSVTNNDPRVKQLFDYVMKHFSSHTYLNYFKEVEKLTLAKRDNLIINIDGIIAVTLLDMFTDVKVPKEMTEKYLEAEAYNGLFVLSRSIGLIAHHIDQKVSGEGLYRHPEYDILQPKETGE